MLVSGSPICDPMLFRRRSQVDSTETFIDQHHCSRSAPSGTPCRRATRKLCSSISVRPVTCNSLGSVATATDAGRPGSVVLFAFTRHSSTFLICGAVISALSMGRFVDGDLRWRSGHVNHHLCVDDHLSLPSIFNHCMSALTLYKYLLSFSVVC